MEELKVHRLLVINRTKRMIGMLSLGDVGQAAPVELLSECVKVFRRIMPEQPKCRAHGENVRRGYHPDKLVRRHGK